MFVLYESRIPLSITEVEQGLDDLRSHLGSWADVAYREGEELRARVGPGVGGVAKEVRLEIGTPEIHRSGLVYPIKWSATGAEILFPKLNADLIVSHIGADETRLVFEGNYEPPLGALGKVVDRALLRRVADSTVKAWVDRLTDALTAGRTVS